jgi:hypothetical protein
MGMLASLDPPPRKAPYLVAICTTPVPGIYHEGGCGGRGHFDYTVGWPIFLGLGSGAPPSGTCPAPLPQWAETPTWRIPTKAERSFRLTATPGRWHRSFHEQGKPAGAPGGSPGSPRRPAPAENGAAGAKLTLSRPSGTEDGHGPTRGGLAEVAAEHLGLVSRGRRPGNRLWELRRAGKLKGLPYLRVGRSYRFDLAHIDAWVKRQVEAGGLNGARSPRPR